MIGHILVRVVQQITFCSHICLLVNKDPLIAFAILRAQDSSSSFCYRVDSGTQNLLPASAHAKSTFFTAEIHHSPSQIPTEKMEFLIMIWIFFYEIGSARRQIARPNWY